MTKTVVKVFVATGLLAAPILAQGWRPLNTSGTPPDPQTMAQMRVNGLARMLDLTDAQKATATTIFAAAYTASQSIRSNSQTARESLSDAVKKNQTAMIDNLAFQIGTYEGQLTAIDSKAEAAFYAILTADQQAISNTMPRGGPGGPGGPMGRGRGGP
jgi:Spy/CpxP family protein refolding chaperone